MSYRIGNYRLVRLIGQGGFGRVYLAEHIHLGTPAAVKLLLQQVNQEAFLREARTIASLRHPHIIRILDFGVTGDSDEGFTQKRPYLITEYAPNGTLRQKHLHGKCAPVETVVSYLQQIADGLQYAHNRQVIHRDIKPDNLLLDEDMQVVISDFGLALHGSRRFTDKDIVGTLAYMSPEQFAGKPRRASDQYALGIMAYEWLAGTVPFHGSLGEIAGQHQSSPPPSLRGKNPNISSALERVVFKALAKDPKQRFASVQEFATAFAQTVAMMPSYALRPVSLAGQPPVAPIAPTQDGRRTALMSQPPIAPASQPLPVPVMAPTPVMVNAPLSGNTIPGVFPGDSIKPAESAAHPSAWMMKETPFWFHLVWGLSWLVWFILMCCNGKSVGDSILLRLSSEYIPVWSWVIPLSSILLFFGWGWIAGCMSARVDTDSIYYRTVIGIVVVTWILSGCMVASWGDTPFDIGSLLVGALFPGVALCVVTIPIGAGATALGFLLGRK